MTVNLFEIAAQRYIGYGLTKIEVPEYGKPILRVKVWRTVDEDGVRRPQYYGPKYELSDGYWQPRLAGDA